MSRYARRPRPEEGEPGDCLTIAEFCARNRISTQFYYKLRSKGQAPTEMRLGTRVLISKEAAEEWRRRLEQPPAA